MGLVNRVVADTQVDRVTAALAVQLARGPARTLARTKELLQRSSGNDLTSQLTAEEESFIASVGCTEFEEGVEAFAALVPEPATMMLLPLGAMSLWFYRITKPPLSR